jgi:NAD(P)-dependent dehydrogenase (short-subunit alcohol dehydrogenase family)
MVEEELAAREALGQGAGDQLLEKFLSAQPISRMATPEEVAEAVCFLASPVNALLTGAVLTLDGGLTCL